MRTNSFGGTMTTMYWSLVVDHCCYKSGRVKFVVAESFLVGLIFRTNDRELFGPLFLLLLLLLVVVVRLCDIQFSLSSAFIDIKCELIMEGERSLAPVLEV